MIDRSEEPIWAPSKQKIDSSNIKNFSKYLSKCDLGDYNNYDDRLDLTYDSDAHDGKLPPLGWRHRRDP